MNAQPIFQAPASAPVDRGSDTPPTSVSRAVTGAIHRITAGGDTPRSRSALARLRQAATRAPGSAPETWEFELELPAALTRFPTDDPAAAGSGASAAEVAVHAALGLWALHQQSKTSPMHRDGVRFGTAVRRLEGLRGGGEGDTSPVLRRFSALVRSGSVAGILVHARGLVGQLRDADLPVDYGRFAVDLYRYQNPEQRNRVRLDWGRAFQNTLVDSLDPDQSSSTSTDTASTDARSTEETP